jgi:hypothetical protein
MRWSDKFATLCLEKCEQVRIDLVRVVSYIPMARGFG